MSLKAIDRWHLTCNRMEWDNAGTWELLFGSLTIRSTTGYFPPKRLVFGFWIHSKLRNINPHIVTHSLISWNPRVRMFVIQISLLIVTFLSFVSQILSLMHTIKEVNPHPCISPCVNMWSVFFFFHHLLNVGACIHHIAWEGQVEWTTPHH